MAREFNICRTVSESRFTQDPMEWRFGYDDPDSHREHDAAEPRRPHRASVTALQAKN